MVVRAWCLLLATTSVVAGEIECTPHALPANVPRKPTHALPANVEASNVDETRSKFTSTAGSLPVGVDIDKFCTPLQLRPSTGGAAR